MDAIVLETHKQTPQRVIGCDRCAHVRTVTEARVGGDNLFHNVVHLLAVHLERERGRRKEEGGV